MDNGLTSEMRVHYSELLSQAKAEKMCLPFSVPESFGLDLLFCVMFETQLDGKFC